MSQMVFVLPWKLTRLKEYGLPCNQNNTVSFEWPTQEDLKKYAQKGLPPAAITMIKWRVA